MHGNLQAALLTYDRVSHFFIVLLIKIVRCASWCDPVTRFKRAWVGITSHAGTIKRIGSGNYRLNDLPWEIWIGVLMSSWCRSVSIRHPSCFQVIRVLHTFTLRYHSPSSTNHFWAKLSLSSTHVFPSNTVLAIKEMCHLSKIQQVLRIRLRWDSNTLTIDEVDWFE